MIGGVIDWDMRGGKRGRLCWNLTNNLEDLDYADDIALLASKHGDIQEKTSRLLDIGKAVGLNINPSETKALRLNCKKNDLIGAVGGNKSTLKPRHSVDKKVARRQISNHKRRLALLKGMLLPHYSPCGNHLSTVSSKTKLRIVAILLYGQRCGHPQLQT